MLVLDWHGGHGETRFTTAGAELTGPARLNSPSVSIRHVRA
jgi:hypothetical protein